MNIVFFSHPDFLGHQSMPRFTSMLANGMKEIGHDVQVWAPKAMVSKVPGPGLLKKWLGYIDQYLIFPAEVKKRIKNLSSKTLFVFTDHALGPWVPLVADRPHVIHCHDFLAQRSANDEIEEHRTSNIGKAYQKIIRKGYSQGKYFISVSKKTREDLHTFLNRTPIISEVVYNGLNRTFAPGDVKKIRSAMSHETGINLTEGYLLHVGGNQWYKNRIGVIEIYNTWRENYQINLPLLLIGQEPDSALKIAHIQSQFFEDIHFISAASDNTVRNAYASASVLLFPSYDEGFGWPIAEAMASGCPVLTTDKPPMTEVAADAGFYIPKRPWNSDTTDWAEAAADRVEEIIGMETEEYAKVVANGLCNAARFNQTKVLDSIEAIYVSILEKETCA